MKVNIVTEGAWIKKFWSDKIKEYNKTPMQYDVSYNQNQSADINFYICFNTFLGKPKTKCDIGYVTHIHNNSAEEHSKDIMGDFNYFRKLDGYIHQSQRSLRQLQEYGFKGKHFNLTSPVEIHKFFPTIRLGIIQNGEVEGKGLYFLKQLLEFYDFSNFKFIFCGRGWEEVIQVMATKKIRYETYSYTKEEYFEVKQSELYEKMDYLFVPSLWEGGPVAPLEALASGRPIISSDVGLIPEFNIEHMFPAGDIQKCIERLNSIQSVYLDRRLKVEQLSYVDFNNKIYDIFKAVLDIN